MTCFIVETALIEELADVQVMIDQFTSSNPALDEKYQQIQLEVEFNDTIQPNK